MRTALETHWKPPASPPPHPTSPGPVSAGSVAAPPAPTPHPPGSGVHASSGGQKPPRIRLAPLADAGSSSLVPPLRRPSSEPVRLEPFDASIDPVAADAAFTLTNPLDRCITRLARDLLVRALPEADELIEPALVHRSGIG